MEGVLPVRTEGITCPDCAGADGRKESCKRCVGTGKVESYTNNFRDTVKVCDNCKGEGCELCYGTGAIVIHPKSYGYSPTGSIDLVPMPYGKILPDLTNCHYVNEPDLCPNCGSDHVVGLDKRHNPFIEEEQGILSNRWFCITCQDSWCYERER